jgi:hypothetical protein
LDGVTFLDCDLNYALFFMIEGKPNIHGSSCSTHILISREDTRDAGERYARGVSQFVSDGEVAICIDERLNIEAHNVPVRVAPFVADRSVVSNKQFSSFIKEELEFSRKIHLKEIENKYYLAYMPDDEGHELVNKPVVYV